LVLVFWPKPPKPPLPNDMIARVYQSRDARFLRSIRRLALSSSSRPRWRDLSVKLSVLRKSSKINRRRRVKLTVERDRGQPSSTTRVLMLVDSVPFVVAKSRSQDAARSSQNPRKGGSEFARGLAEPMQGCKYYRRKKKKDRQ
jgi:hypothetical protein